MRKHVRLDARRQYRHGRIDDALAEVIQRQRQVGAGEVEVNTLLRGDGQGGRSFGGVLSAQGGAVADDVLVRQADLQVRADLRAGLGVRLVVVAGDIADEIELLVKDAQRLS